MTRYEVVYGLSASGKSFYVVGLMDIDQSFKFGTSSRFLETVLLNFGSMSRHERDNRGIGLRFKRVTLSGVIDDIKAVEDPTLLLDEWTSFFYSSMFWSEEMTRARISEIFSALDGNPRLERTIFICSYGHTHLPFRLYKKKAIWNKILFARADSITKVEYGIPIRIVTNGS